MRYQHSSAQSASLAFHVPYKPIIYGNIFYHIPIHLNNGGKNMTEIRFLSSSSYVDSKNRNYGDCILINTGNELVIYDCGSIEHAEHVIEYMQKHNYSKAKLILSHNDSDHFNGIPKLLEEDLISEIHTTLLLKYKDDILDRIDDHRRNRDTVGQQILEYYDNIAQLSGAPLVDIYEDSTPICDEIEIIGPDKDYMLDTVAKYLDGREGDTQDCESAVNATSIQVSVSLGKHKILLCGDCSYRSIDDKVRNFDAIQLPHHGKAKQAELIFEKKSDQISALYIVSDNTGSTKGGSDNLNTKGHRIKNTKNSSLYMIATVLFLISL